MASLAPLHRDDAHRLVPAKYSHDGSVLGSLQLPAEVLADLSEIDAATNERKIAEGGGSSGITPSELLIGVPEAHIINAAFCHPGPHGSRFNDARRGAWYAGFELETSSAEVAYHKRIFLRDMRCFGEEIPFEYQDFLADFDGRFHHLDADEEPSCLKPDPVPQCYAAGQILAATLLNGGSPGLIYPSVRHAGGTCIACFRPALVFHPRRGNRYEITIEADSDGFGLREMPRS